MSVVVVLAAAAESLHARACHRVARLAFGPEGHPARWARSAPALRVVSLGALTWGLVTLYQLEAKTHRSAEEIPESEKRHLILVLDVSPSMRLKDAGVDHKQSRMQRARDVLDSLFGRVGIRQYLVSVVATYNGAIPVVERSHDSEVLRNILNDLPMHYAFPKGNTDLFAGLEEAARIAKPLRPGSATLILVSDGDTIPASGMPKLPPAVGSKLVIGVGDTKQGTFIDGRHSRQEASALRQIAIRVGGTYHDGNEKHVGSEILRTIAQSGDAGQVDRLTAREYALLACALGAACLAVLPLALQRFGTAWRPGKPGALASTGNSKGRKAMGAGVT
ncbi:MAG: VWA domain-containing protein [Planctomycetes bacterium]|nr:VWA domain-containing protein [Planctomycetota bacterium]